MQDRNKSMELLEQASSVAEYEKLLAAPYQWVRIQAAERLGELRSANSVNRLGQALCDRCEYVATSAAEALAQIGGTEAFDILRMAFIEGDVARPHYLANAIAKFGHQGKDLLISCLENDSPSIRYYAARGLGTTGDASVKHLLQKLAENDNAKCSFGGLVSTGAKEALKVLERVARMGK